MNVDPDNIFYIVDSKSTSKVIKELLSVWEERGYTLTKLYYVNYKELDKLIISEKFLEDNQYQVLVIYTNDKVIPFEKFIDLTEIYNIGIIFIGDGLDDDYKKDEIIYILNGL
jgi:hypothetical protein